MECHPNVFMTLDAYVWWAKEFSELALILMTYYSFLTVRNEYHHNYCLRTALVQWLGGCCLLGSPLLPESAWGWLWLKLGHVLSHHLEKGDPQTGSQRKPARWPFGSLHPHHPLHLKAPLKSQCKIRASLLFWEKLRSFYYLSLNKPLTSGH